VIAVQDELSDGEEEQPKIDTAEHEFRFEQMEMVQLMTTVKSWALYSYART
jgi:hypothetical protein